MLVNKYKLNKAMKRYQETMLKDFEILLPYILLLGVLVLLAISVYLLQDFTKIYQIYTIC